MTAFTIGYGGRPPAEFLRLLREAGVRTLADVRLRPDRSSMGSYKHTGKPDTGIEKLLTEAGIGYVSLPELGNLFLGYDDSLTRYEGLYEKAGPLLIERLLQVPSPFCLMCAEKSVEQCHRKTIAKHLTTLGYEFTHL